MHTNIKFMLWPKQIVVWQEMEKFTEENVLSYDLRILFTKDIIALTG
jgi:hypothetical protein